MANESESKQKFMTKPLPQILDEIEESIGLADEAAKNARNAALEARAAGENAAAEVTRSISERIASVEATAHSAMQLAEQLRGILLDCTSLVEKGLSQKVSPQQETTGSE